MPDTPQRRGCTRVTVVREAEIGSDAIAVVGTQTKDLSLKGVYLYSSNTLPEGARCTVRLLLEGAGRGIVIETHGIVRRVDPEGMGIEFDEIADTESFAHLQNLVLLNASNPDTIQQEFDDGTMGPGE